MDAVYRDRREAGRALGEQLRDVLSPMNPIVLAVARGGVPVGYEVAHALEAPLDVIVVRRLPLPGQPEVSLGAIAVGGVERLDAALVESLGLTPFEIAAIADGEIAALQQCAESYREGRPALELRGYTAVVVDDGIASGYTMRAAVEAVRQLGPARIIAAAPVGVALACDALVEDGVTVWCPLQMERTDQVGRWYHDFRHLNDRQVRECLTLAAPAQEAHHFAVA